MPRKIPTCAGPTAACMSFNEAAAVMPRKMPMTAATKEMGYVKLQ